MNRIPRRVFGLSGYSILATLVYTTSAVISIAFVVHMVLRFA